MLRVLWLPIKQWWRLRLAKRNASLFDITVLMRQLATLINAGIPLLKTCSLLEINQSKIALKQLLHTIQQDILAGKSLSLSLQRYQHYFDPMTCHLIKLGEYTGQLDKVLYMIADQKEQQLAFKRRIQQALFYPAIIIITTILAMACILLFIIPRFEDFFQQTNVQLPLLTHWIFALADSMPWVGGGFILLLIFIGFYFTHHRGAVICRIKRFPGLRTIFTKITLAGFARQLALACHAGMPIHTALQLLIPAFHSTLPLYRLSQKICAGRALHDALEGFSEFPTLLVQLVKTGEESGMLPDMLDKAAYFYEADIDQLLKQGDQLLEPLIILILGVLIGGLVIGMYLPIFKLGTAF